MSRPFTWEQLWSRPSLASTGLLPASWAYAAGLRLRPPVLVTRVEGLQVVSVGNLVAGGAGKTPVVLFLAQRALAAGRKVAVLSRGYGRRASQPVHWARRVSPLPSVDDVGDEPRLIARRLPDVELFIDSNRVSAAQAARAGGCEVALLDDGFQHRRLFRDANLLIDAGIGNGRLLPAGPLREPLAASARADVVWARDGARSFDGPPSSLRVEAQHVVETLLSPEGDEVALSALHGKRIVVVAGLARPSQFLKMLRDAGAEAAQTYLFEDHHPFSARDVAQVQASAAQHRALIVTTEKDRERLPPSLPLWLPRMSIRVTSGLQALSNRLGW